MQCLQQTLYMSSLHILDSFKRKLRTIIWEPYTHTLGSLLAYCIAGQYILKAEVPLIYFWIVEGHHPERVFRQFGMKQPVSLFMETLTALHRISLQELVEELGRLKLADALTEASDIGTQAPGRGGQSGGSRGGGRRGGGLAGRIQLVEELGRLKLADALTEASDIGTQSPGRGGQSGGSRGGGRRGGGLAGRIRMTKSDPIYEEGDDSGAKESWLGTDWVLSDDGGRTPRCTSSTGAGPSHTVGHEDTVPAQTTSRGASTDYEDPPHLSPSVFGGSAHNGGCIFVPTPSMPTPPLVHVDPTMATSSPTPHEKVVQIEQLPAEDIEPMEGLRRLRCPPAYAPDCRTDDCMYFDYTSHLLELLILCI
ncbi:hypothetical protein SO802_015857 [Lithocarpus litseifolius]|uniref:Aminotransferase-like plant mobile domain-containing protein n=1 Tax=Lithocarpus litseifolius TaxID=425828 RepID=A0AAW2D066_9ROSI